MTIKKNETITYKNKKYPMEKFCGEFGISMTTIRKKLNEGEEIENILKNTRRGPGITKVIYRNKEYRLRLLCDKLNINVNVFCKALESGLSVTEIVNKWKNSDTFKWDEEQKKSKEENKNTKEVDTSAIRFPIQLTSAAELIDTLKRNNDMFPEFDNPEVLFNINIVDYENICNDTNMIQELLKEENCINIFFFNSCIYSNRFFKNMKNLTKPIFYVITVDSESQLVDHLMLYYTGLLSGLIEGNTVFNIISKDSHFYKLKIYIYDSKINVKGVDYIDDKDDKFVTSIANYLINNRYINDNSAIKQDEFGIIFKNFFKLRNKQMTKDNLNNLIDRLVDLEFLNYHEETSTYSEYYSFNLIKAKQEVRRIKKNRAA